MEEKEDSVKPETASHHDQDSGEMQTKASRHSSVVVEKDIQVDADQPQCNSDCVHCGQPFKSYKPLAVLCPRCFIAGHRGFSCDKYCIVTPASAALAAQYGQRKQSSEASNNPELSKDSPASLPESKSSSDISLTLAEIREDIADSVPSSSPTGLFRQHCVGLLAIIDSLQAENESLRTKVEQVQFDLKQAKGWIAGVEEREAACCPEDVGFDEHIKTLTCQLSQLEQERDAAASNMKAEIVERVRELITDLVPLEVECAIVSQLEGVEINQEQGK